MRLGTDWRSRLLERNSLGVEDGVPGVHGSVVLGGLTNQTLLISEGDERRGGERTLLVGDDLDIGTLVRGNARVGGTCGRRVSTWQSRDAVCRTRQRLEAVKRRQNGGRDTVGPFEYASAGGQSCSHRTAQRAGDLPRSMPMAPSYTSSAILIVWSEGGNSSVSRTMGG